MTQYSILLLDDQPEVRRVLRAGIETLGSQYKVVDLPSAEEAMLVLFSQKFDLLVSDVRLPGISGIELTERVRRRNPSLKVILITGMSDQRVRRQISSMGASAFFIKPIQLAEFLEAVQAALNAPETAATTPVQPVVETPKPEPSKLVTAKPESKQHPPPALEPAPSRIRSRYKPDNEPAISAAETAEAAPKDPLAALRKEMGAQAIAILNEDGTVAVQNGELPMALFAAGLPEQLAIAGRASTVISKGFNTASPENLLFFNGPSFNLMLASLDATHSLLVVSTRSSSLLGNAAASIQNARPALLELASQAVPVATAHPAEAHPLLDILAGLSEANTPAPTVEVPEIPQVEVSEEDLLSVEALFQQLPGQSPTKSSAHDFWDNLVEGNSLDGNVKKDGALSYEEALRLGIAPGQE
jgi:CheY-like chemotaxis protein